MKVVAFILARQGSKRFPNKVMADIGGVPMLGRIVERLRKAEAINNVVVATNVSSPDITNYCVSTGIDYYIGSENDVLDRLYQSARSFEADIVIRIWHDSPLIDPRIIDRIVPDFIQKGYDFASLRNYPKGLYFNLAKFQALTMLVSDISPIDRAIWNRQSEEWVWIKSGFKVNTYFSPFDFSHLNFEVNTLDDLDRVRAIYAGEGDV